MFAVSFLVAACETAKAPPPNYMAAMDGIALAFGPLAKDMEAIGEDLMEIEWYRSQPVPDTGEGLTDEELATRFAHHRANLRRIKEKIAQLARTFEILTNVPENKDESDRQIYVEHNKSMEALLKALLGADEDDKIRTSTHLRDVIVEVRTAGSDEDPRKTNAQALVDKGVFLVYDSGGTDRVGYLDTLDDYLRLNLRKLRGRAQVTVCVMSRKTLSENTYEGVVDNVELRVLLGGTPLIGSFGRSGESSRLGRRSLVMRNYLWTMLYTKKEREVVIHLKRLIKGRKRIAEYRRTAS